MKVLIVDDDPTIRLTLNGLLKKHDCQIIEAESGAQALDIIQSNEPPQLIFMDWNMPGLTGLEVASLLRETVEENPPYVIIVSSNSTDEQIIEALSYGADDYIIKPIDGHFLNAKFAVAKRILEAQEKLKQANLVLKQLAYNDELTGLLNRRAGYASFQVEVERCSRRDQSMCVALADIDHFKAVNDTYGHSVGDEVLKAFAKKLTQTVRPYDVVCRYGGEEFMLLAEINNTSEAKELFERVRRAVADIQVKVADNVITITASFGVCVVEPSVDSNLTELLKHADEALYQAKGDGRNRVVVFDQDDMLENHTEELKN